MKSLFFIFIVIFVAVVFGADNDSVVVRDKKDSKGRIERCISEIAPEKIWPINMGDTVEIVAKLRRSGGSVQRLFKFTYIDTIAPAKSCEVTVLRNSGYVFGDIDTCK